MKIAFLMVGAGGVYALSRSFGAHARWAAVVGTAAPLAGFTFYMDSTAWVTGLFIWALLPWFWVALRRAVYGGRNPAWTLVLAYLTVTVGYVYGTIGIIFVLVGVGLERIIARQWQGVRKRLGSACWPAWSRLRSTCRGSSPPA